MQSLLERRIEEIAGGLVEDFPAEMATRTGRERAWRLLARLLPNGKAGRPRKENVTRAEEMLAKRRVCPTERRWPGVIYQQCIPGYDQMSRTEQTGKRGGLQSAVRWRYRQRRADHLYDRRN